METLTLPAQQGLSREKKTAIIYASVMILIHLGILLTIWTGVSPVAFWVAFAFYLIRGFGISIGYHRYFSHKSYKTGRFFQFIIALMGSVANQGGVQLTVDTTNIQTKKKITIHQSFMVSGILILVGCGQKRPI